MTQEIWRDVVGLERYFKVSNTGKVHGKYRLLKTKRSIMYGGDKLLKGCKTVEGFRRVILNYEGKKSYRYIHVLVAEAFMDDYKFKDNGSTLKHLDGNKENNHIDNLTLAKIGL